MSTRFSRSADDLRGGAYHVAYQRLDVCAPFLECGFDFGLVIMLLINPNEGLVADPRLVIEAKFSDMYRHAELCHAGRERAVVIGPMGPR